MVSHDTTPSERAQTIPPVMPGINFLLSAPGLPVVSPDTMAKRALTLYGFPPTSQTDTRIEWKYQGWTAIVQDNGPAWAAYFNGLSIGLAYGRAGSAKTGIENHIRREHKLTSSIVAGPKAKPGARRAPLPTLSGRKLLDS